MLNPQELLKLWKQLQAFLEKRYPRESPILLPNTVQSKSPQFFWLRHRHRIIQDGLIAITVLLIIIVVFHYVSILGLVQDLKSLPLSKEGLDFILRGQLLLSFSLQVPIFVALAIMAIVILTPRIWRVIEAKTRWWLLGVLVVLTVANSAYQSVRGIIIANHHATAYKNALNAFQHKEWDIAETLIDEIMQSGQAPELVEELEALRAGTEYYNGDPRSATMQACNWLSHNTRSPEKESMKITIHWSTYKLGKDKDGKNMNLEVALKEVEALRNRVGNICQAEVSPYWLGISPSNEIALRMLIGTAEPPMSLTQKEFSQPIAADDLDRLRQIVRIRPGEPYLDYALYLFGDYVKLINERPKSDLVRRAYFRGAGAAIEQKDYKTALDLYERFQKEYPKDKWYGKALAQMGWVYELQGERHRALELYLQSADDGKNRAQYLAAYVMPIEELSGFLNTHRQQSTLEEELDYLLGRRLFEERQFIAARDQFSRFLNLYSSSSLRKQAEYNLRIIDQVIRLDPQQVNNLDQLAYYLLDELDSKPPEGSVLTRQFFWDETGRPIPDAAREAQNIYLWAALLLDKYMSSHPSAASSPDMLYRMAVAYDKGWAEEEARKAYWDYLRLYYNSSSPQVKFVMERIALMSLDVSSSVDQYNTPKYERDRIQRMISEAQNLVDLYPQHDLANNLLNWIAWGYCYMANNDPQSDIDYLVNYKLALATYKDIVTRYPKGCVTDNAREAIQIIEAKLSNPSKRVRVDPKRWYWFKCEQR